MLNKLLSPNFFRCKSVNKKNPAKFVAIITMIKRGNILKKRFLKNKIKENFSFSNPSMIDLLMKKPLNTKKISTP